MLLGARTGAWSGGGDIYRFVTALKSNGNCAIVTDYIPLKTDEVVVKGMYVYARNGWIFHCDNGWTNNGFGSGYDNQVFYFGGEYIGGASDISGEVVEHNITNGINVIKKEGTEIYRADLSSQTLNASYPVCLFSGYRLGSFIEYQNTDGARVDRMTVRRNGVLIHDYNPCIKIVTSEPMIVDVVSGSEFTNSLDGTFTVID